VTFITFFIKMINNISLI